MSKKCPCKSDEIVHSWNVLTLLHIQSAEAIADKPVSFTHPLNHLYNLDCCVDCIEKVADTMIKKMETEHTKAVHDENKKKLNTKLKEMKEKRTK